MTKIFKNSFGAKFFSVVCLIVCVALSLTLADFFSNVITTTAFSSTTGKIKGGSFSIYAIKLYSAATQAQANDLSANAKQKNCAGYIYMTNTEYMILASGYENLSDAEKVETNLKKSEIQCEIVTIDFPKLELSTNFSSTEKTTLENAVGIFRSLYKKLYDLSVTVDTNLSTEIESKLELANIISDFTKIKASFESIFNSRITTEILELKLSLANVNKILDNLSNFSDSTIPYSAQIKHSYFEILSEHLALAKKI